MSLDRYFLPVLRQSAETESRQLQPSCSPTEQNDSSFSAEPDNSGCSVSVSEQPEDLGTIDSKPAQPSLGIYAPKQFGSITRDFKKAWFFNREWLEFSISRKAAFVIVVEILEETRTIHILQHWDIPTGSMHWKRIKDLISMFIPINMYGQ